MGLLNVILKGLIIWLILVLIVNFIDSWILKDYGKIFMSILFGFVHADLYLLVRLGMTILLRFGAWASLVLLRNG